MKRPRVPLGSGQRQKARLDHVVLRAFFLFFCLLFPRFAQPRAGINSPQERPDLGQQFVPLYRPVHRHEKADFFRLPLAPHPWACAARHRLERRGRIH